MSAVLRRFSRDGSAKKVNRLNTSGETRLFRACEKSNVKKVRSLLSSSHTDVNLVDPKGESPLYAACLAGNEEVIKELVTDSRTDVNLSNPFHLLCRKERMDLIAILSPHEEVNINQRNQKGATPFKDAIDNDRSQVLEFLWNDPRVDINAMRSPLYTACEQGRINLVKRLLNDPRIATTEALVPLTAACKKNHLDIVKMFLQDNRIDINAAQKFKLDCIPFVAACVHKNLRIVLEFLKEPSLEYTSLMIRSMKVSEWYKTEERDVVEEICLTAMARDLLLLEDIKNEDLHKQLSTRVANN